MKRALLSFATALCLAAPPCALGAGMPTPGEVPVTYSVQIDGGAMIAVTPVKSLLASTSEVVEHAIAHPDGTRTVTPVPGAVSIAALTFDVPVDHGATFEQWRALVTAGGNGYQKTLTLYVRDAATNREILTETMTKAWPSALKYSLGGDGTPIERITIVFSTVQTQIR